MNNNYKTHFQNAAINMKLIILKNQKKAKMKLTYLNNNLNVKIYILYYIIFKKFIFILEALKVQLE